ncbi:MAG: PEP-CTERM sorting domain-containing protein [Verrucomicrobiota bacterium]|nr:PEP-CTERM sorting domain-containing protein [Verrucomicrobiota bacterium]
MPPKIDLYSTPVHRRIDAILILLSIAIALLVVTSAARAGDKKGGARGDPTWTGATNAVWNLNSNWTPNTGYPNGPTDVATFNTIANANTTLTLSSNVTVLSIGFGSGGSNAAAYAIGTTGGSSIVLSDGGDITVNSSVTTSQLINAPIVLGTGANTGSYPFVNNSTTANQLLTIGGNVTSGTSNTGGTTTLTLDGSGNGIINGVISGNGSGNGSNTTATVAVSKSGAGTWTLSAVDTYSGKTTVNTNGGVLEISNNGTTTAGRLTATTQIIMNSGGTILLDGGATGSTDRINNAATVSMAGGTLKLSGTSEGTAATVGLGALTLTSNSIIDLSGTSLVHFAASNASPWTANTTLSIYNWSGTLTLGGGLEEILFGSNNTALTSAQLAQIRFYSDSGTTFLGTGGFTTTNTGEVVPVPEPSTWAAGGLTLLAVGWMSRKRLWARTFARIRA